MAARPPAAQVRRNLDRLRALRGDPPARAAFAAELLEGDPGAEVLAVALEVLAGHPLPAVHDALVKLYGALEAPKRDPGGFQRATILRALRTIVLPGDAPLLERAATTVEFSPNDPAGGANLRATALVTLADLDPDLAGFHAAARLALGDDPRQTSTMTGEPAVTAARVLGALGQQLPLLVAVQGIPGLHGEVAAACLAELRDLPDAVLEVLLDQLFKDDREAVRLGLADLLVHHAPTPPLLAGAHTFLRATQEIDIYRYFIASAVAERRAEIIALVAAAAAEEFDRERLEVLREQLGIRAGDPVIDVALAIVVERLAVARR